MSFKLNIPINQILPKITFFYFAFKKDKTFFENFFQKFFLRTKRRLEERLIQ